MTAERMKMLAEFLREFRRWLEDEHPGSIDGSIVAWCETVVGAELRQLIGGGK